MAYFFGNIILGQMVYYLLSTYGKATATNLSRLLDGLYSHDQVTRLLSRNQFTSKTLWGFVKPTVRQVENDDGVLVYHENTFFITRGNEKGIFRSWLFGSD